MLLDLVDCTTLPESGEVQSAAERVTMDPASLRFGRLAIVVDSDALFGMLRMFHSLSDAAFTNAQIFRDRDQVQQWLGEPGPPA